MVVERSVSYGAQFLSKYISTIHSPEYSGT
jgi:hypothetical protein